MLHTNQAQTVLPHRWRMWVIAAAGLVIGIAPLAADAQQRPAADPAKSPNLAAAIVPAAPAPAPAVPEAPKAPLAVNPVTGPSLVFDAKDGRVLYAEDVDSQWFPASLTKIMTAYVTFDAIKEGKLTLETRIAASEYSQSMPASKVGLPVGATMPVDLALKAVIIKSANDVSVMLAEAISGSEAAFVDRMNATAQRLGMTRTKFQNANGLPHADQVTTARDLAKLARAALRDYPEYAAYWAMGDVRIGRRKLRSHNGLLRTYEGTDGMKTGFICDSGYNVVATANRDGRKLVAVVLGQVSGGERNLRAANLMQLGFDRGAWHRLVSRDTIDTLAMDPEAKTAASIRKIVLTRECSGRGRRRAAPVAKRPKTKAQQISASKAKSQPKVQVKTQQVKAQPAKAKAQ
jgi:D-alanyl-D-alanine carboxypeptidase